VTRRSMSDKARRGKTVGLAQMMLKLHKDLPRAKTRLANPAALTGCLPVI